MDFPDYPRRSGAGDTSYNYGSYDGGGLSHVPEIIIEGQEHFPPSPEVPETGEISRRKIFGHLSDETLEAAHPYRPAEGISPEVIDDYYSVPVYPDGTWKAWRNIERSLSDPSDSRLHIAAEQLEEACEQYAPIANTRTPADNFATTRDSERWFDAAFAKANLPTFVDRLTHGQVHAETARGVYEALVSDVMPNTVADGDMAEAIISALGARAVSLGGSGSLFYITGPREGANYYRSPNVEGKEGKILNHDAYELTDGLKMPLEVKVAGNTSRRPSDYDKGITVVRCFNTLAPAILGIDVENRPPGSPSFRKLIPAFGPAVHALMQREIESGVPESRLSQAYQDLRAAIAEDRKNKRVPELYRTT